MIEVKGELLKILIEFLLEFLLQAITENENKKKGKNMIVEKHK